MSGGHVEVVCACCGQLGIHTGRGLRKRCYDAHRRAGTLAQYPRLPRNLPTLGRLQDFAELLASGLSLSEAAERLGVTRRTGERYAAALRPQQQAVAS